MVSLRLVSLNGACDEEKNIFFVLYGEKKNAGGREPETDSHSSRQREKKINNVGGEDISRLSVR